MTSSCAGKGCCGWWVASLCSLSAAIALGVSAFWVRVVAQAISRPPSSVYDDPFMSAITVPVLWGGCYIAPIALVLVVGFRARFLKLPPGFQPAIACLLLLGVAYCVTTYGAKVEAVARGSEYRTATTGSTVGGQIKEVVACLQRNPSAWAKDWFFDDEGYHLWVDRGTLEKTPTWDVQRDAFPPLAMREALSVAMAWMSDRFPGRTWRISDCRLSFVGGGNGLCCYVVEFEQETPWQQFAVIVLMDGSVHPPDKVDSKEPRTEERKGG